MTEKENELAGKESEKGQGGSQEIISEWVQGPEGPTDVTNQLHS